MHRENKSVYLYICLFIFATQSAAYKHLGFSLAEGTQTHTLRIMTIGESSLWQLSTQPEDINKGTIERNARFLYIATHVIITEKSGSMFKDLFLVKRTSRSFLWFFLWWDPTSPPKKGMMKGISEEEIENSWKENIPSSKPTIPMVMPRNISFWRKERPRMMYLPPWWHCMHF